LRNGAGIDTPARLDAKDLMRLPALSLTLLLAAALAAPSLHASAGGERFGRRAWFGSERAAVVVEARLDLFALRVPGAAPEGVAVLVEQLLAKVPGVTSSVVETWPLGRRGAVAVMLTTPLSAAQAATLTRLVETAAQGHLWPAVARGPKADHGFPAGRAFTDDHLVVTAAPGRLEEVLATVVEKTGAVKVEKTRLKHTALVQVGAAVGHDAIAASVAVRDVAGVVAAEPDLYRELELRAVADDPLFAQQWHLGGPRQRAGGGAVPGVGEVFADDAWEVTKGNPDVVVAVFDSGTDWQHPDLVANVRQDLMFDASAGDLDPRPECEGSQDGRAEAASCPAGKPYRESHGTSVSGTIAAVADNQVGVAGVCPQCTLAPVRLLGEATQDGLSIAEAFVKSCDPTGDETGQGAWIINNSWGPGFSLFFPLSRAEQDAFELCRTVGRGGKGTVILFAAGNSTADVSRDAYAKHPSVIGVAASTNLDDWASYSNFGAEVDIAAPSLGGTVNEDNFGIVCTDVAGDDGYDAGDYNPGFSGTSAASPVAAGVAGLVLSVNPDLSAEQVRLVLTRTADKITADKVPWDQIFRQDLEAAFAYDDTGHSIAFGFGRVDAAAAVALAGNAAELGTIGARCETTSADCPVCSPEGVCLTTCDEQADCPSGSVCTDGACAVPREASTDFGALCNADCTWCVGTLDTQFTPTEICSVECTVDTDCDPACDGEADCTTDSFDCRPATDDPNGVKICAIGDPNGGGPADFGACFNSQLFTSVVVQSDGGRELCGDICFSDDPAGCPYGFHCAEVTCACTRDSSFGCREFTCFEAGALGSGAGDFFFPICVPDAGHADVCEVDVDCQAGDYCLDGRCRYDDRGGCDICATCTTSADCGGRGVCVGTLSAEGDERPGVCATACDDGEACPGNASCREVEIFTFRGNGAIRAQTIQACLDDRVPSFEGASPQDYCEGFTCEVGCRADLPCGDGLVCDSGACVPAPAGDEGEAEDLSLGGGGFRFSGCGSCSASGGEFGVFGIALLALLLRRRR
jgi:subtilisin family serine protease